MAQGGTAAGGGCHEAGCPLPPLTGRTPQKTRVVDSSSAPPHPWSPEPRTEPRSPGSQSLCWFLCAGWLGNLTSPAREVEREGHEVSNEIKCGRTKVGATHPLSSPPSIPAPEAKPTMWSENKRRGEARGEERSLLPRGRTCPVVTRRASWACPSVVYANHLPAFRLLLL